LNDPVLNILLVDDDLGDVRQIARAIRKSGLAAECVQALSAEHALEQCELRGFDCVLIDYLLPGKDGLEALSDILRRYPFVAVVMATGQGDETVATEAMKRGAADYIRKADINTVSIRRVVENAVEKANLRKKVADQQQELARFADVLVHDLRAPSSAIQTFVWDIQDALRDGNMELVTQFCEFAAHAAARMDALIATLYQYTRADGEVIFEPVAMGLVLEDALTNLHDVVHSRHAIVTHEALPAVTGSISLLVQLLQNLIGNGLKYCTDPVPRIHVSARPQESGMWLFSVADNGIGVPEKDQKRIFESFTRLHGIGEYEGTGLGLATCRKIVARHGGAIWCESEEGHGTTIFFTLQDASASAASVDADIAEESAEDEAQSRAA
jgi:signal transduction histidine kinase